MKTLSELQSAAAALHAGGWRSADREQIKSEYEYTDDAELDAVIDLLHGMEPLTVTPKKPRAAAPRYNGWRNRQTWNVALWINNDEMLYNMGREYVKARAAANKPTSYREFIDHYCMINRRTPDNISWSGTRLDYKALDEMMTELI